MICSSMTTYLESSTVQDYVKHVNDDLYPLLLHKQPIPDKAWLPSSPEPSSPERLQFPSTRILCLAHCQAELASSSTLHRNDCEARRPMVVKPQLQSLRLLRYPSSKLVLKMPKQT